MVCSEDGCGHWFGQKQWDFFAKFSVFFEKYENAKIQKCKNTKKQKIQKCIIITIIITITIISITIIITITIIIIIITIIIIIIKILDFYGDDGGDDGGDDDDDGDDGPKSAFSNFVPYHQLSAIFGYFTIEYV